MKQIKIIKSQMNEAVARIDALERLMPPHRDCLRLLTEEMFFICKEFLGKDAPNFEGKRMRGQYILRMTTGTRAGARERFLSMSNCEHGAANSGVQGLLGTVLEALSFELEPGLYGATWIYGMHPPDSEYDRMWTFSQYMEFAPQEQLNSDWDGMEKSAIANFADDVRIGVRGGKLEMTVTKTF